MEKEKIKTSKTPKISITPSVVINHMWCATSGVISWLFMMKKDGLDEQQVF